MPYIFGFSQSEYSIYTIFLAYWNHGCSAVFPCNIISFLHFIKLFGISFAFIPIFSVTIQKQQFTVSLCTHKLVIILSHKTNKLIPSFAYLIRKSHYFKCIRIRHIGFYSQDMPVRKLMKLFKMSFMFFISYHFSAP